MKSKSKKYNRYKHKHCCCPIHYWEIIVVDFDENFSDNSTIYYHCDYCGVDWLITDFDDESIVYYKEKK